MKPGFNRTTWAGLALAVAVAAGLGAGAVAQTTTTQTTTAPAGAPAAPPGKSDTAATTPAVQPAAQPVADTTTTADETPEPTAAERQKGLIPDEVYDAVFRILFSVLVIALVLESALAVIFHWSIFLRYFDGRGVKSLVSVIVGWLIAYGLHLDVVGRLFGATNTQANTDHPLGNVGYFVTALVLAGGSAGVNNILKALGFRSVLTRDDVTPRPPQTKAWLSVRVRRKAVRDGPVEVLLTKDTDPAVLIGMISGRGSPPAILRGFVTDAARFPMTAGYAVDGGHQYLITVQGKAGAAGQPTAESWGPFRIATGAIVDIELSL